MKRLVILLLGIISYMNASAQVMVLHFNDGSTREYNTENLDFVEFKADSSKVDPSGGNDVICYDFENYFLETQASKYYEWSDPYEDGTQRAVPNWATANKGFSTARGSALPEEYPTVPAPGEGVDGSAAVKLETSSTGSFGKLFNMPLAAGNLFLGTFDFSVALTHTLQATHFGENSTIDKKPVKFTGYYKYTAGPQMTDAKGNNIDGTDKPAIYCVVYKNHDANGNAVVLTGENVDTDTEYVVGRAEVTEWQYNTDDYVYFDIPFTWTQELDETLLANKGYNFAIVCSSSKDGATYTGALGSKLYVDKFRLVMYDDTPISDYIVSSDVKVDYQHTASFDVTVDVPSNISLYAVGVLVSTSSVITLEKSTMLSKNVTSSSAETSFTFTQSGLEMATTYYYRPFVYVVKDGSYHFGEVKSFTTYGNITDGDAIDLGLPSGNLWSSVNLGASTPTDLGDLYAWGETETKESFTLDNYQYYFNGSYFSLGDNISNTEYDAANVKWGSKWHIPSRSEFDELMSYCSYSSTSLYGVDGLVFIGQNGNSIFLPNSSGYWTSEPCYDLNAYMFRMISGNIRRHEGLYIRPVYGDVDTLASNSINIDGTTVTLTNAGVTAGNSSISVDISTLGYENAAAVDVITLSDGTTIKFGTGTNSNCPKYYTATSGVRVYANNTITFTSAKYKIAKIIMECDSYNGTDYVGNTTATLTISGNTIVYTNTSETAGTQLRVKSINIIYGGE